MNLKEQFKKHFEPGYFTRIDNIHPLDLYIGLDDANRYALEFRGEFSTQPIKSSNAIGIAQTEHESYNSITFYLKDTDMFDNFCVFCEDIIRATAETRDSRIGYKAIVNRYYSWRKMFQSKNAILKEQEIMGLIGELLFLRDYMFKKYSAYEALLAWSGQELTHKDFSLDTTWYEVKAISVGKDTVRISSLEQLQSANTGTLVVYQLEKMSPAYKGITLRELATSILDLLDNYELQEMYLGHLVQSGFSFESQYDEYVYELSCRDMFTVDSTFPKLTIDSVPKAIARVQYDLIIADILPFKIS